MRGKELYEKITYIDDDLISNMDNATKSRKPRYVRPIAMVACFALIVAIIPLLLNYIRDSQKDACPWEVEINLNGKSYSVVNTKKSPAYDNYNLEKKITPQLLGEYLGESTIRIDSGSNEEICKIYRYAKAPKTEYDWYPRIIVENSQGEYYHALIASCFNEKVQTANEVLAVYGLLSPKDIASIENQKGKKITNRDFINKFYNGLFTKKYGGNNFMQKNVYENNGIDESEIDKLYTKYADDMVHLKVQLTNGIVIGVYVTSHNYVRVEHDLYFEVDDSWLELVSGF